MAFHIMPFPGQTFPGKYANNDDIKAYFGFGKLVERTYGHDDQKYMTVKAEKLPLDFDGEIQVRDTMGRVVLLTCYPSAAEHTKQTAQLLGKKHQKISEHRVYAECPECGEAISAGRTHQHKCKEHQ